jgi:hypothetical protein
MTQNIYLTIVTIATSLVFLFLFIRANKLIKKNKKEFDDTTDKLLLEHNKQIDQIELELEKYKPLVDLDSEIEKRQALINSLKEDFQILNNKYQAALNIHESLEKEIGLYNESLDLTEYGVYKPKYDFDVPEQYKVELEGIYQQQKQLIYMERAAVCNTEWTVGGSKTEGRRMTRQYIRLMLFAFNGECDALIAKVKWNNANKTQERINKVFESINKLGGVQNCFITTEYLNLKVKELALTHEYEEKKYEEKEEQRRIREMMREEEKAQKEYERAQREAEDEEKRYTRALEKAKKELGFADQSEIEALNERVQLLEQNLIEARNKKERAISLAQMTKVGHIYVISNIGSFGEGVYKIGMTRRLDPMDRVKELGDASVPFRFDVHAIIYSENAPQLEYALHKKFDAGRLNRINGRKEFFKVSLSEIESFIKEQMGAEIQFTKLYEAKEYRETMKLLERFDEDLQEPKQEIKFPQSLFE